LLGVQRLHWGIHYKKSRGVVMLHSFIDSLVESHALWLIWAAAGVLFLALCVVIASAIRSESEEPFYSAAPRRNDDNEMIVRS
jgi:hypothetical protein